MRRLEHSAAHGSPSIALTAADSGGVRDRPRRLNCLDGFGSHQRVFEIQIFQPGGPVFESAAIRRAEFDYVCVFEALFL